MNIWTIFDRRIHEAKFLCPKHEKFGVSSATEKQLIPNHADYDHNDNANGKKIIINAIAILHRPADGKHGLSNEQCSDEWSEWYEWCQFRYDGKW